MSIDQQKPDIERGFDRNVDYLVMKGRLIKALQGAIKKVDTVSCKMRRIVMNRIIYCLIAIIQLRNGSRISEAVNAMQLFIQADNFKDKVTVKIAKSETLKYKKATGEQYMTKIRHRRIVFPMRWFNANKILPILKDVNSYILCIKQDRLKKRVLDYLRKYHKCNTHSLRYACINYLLYTKKLEMAIVAKFVGHSNVNQLVTYTQLKNTDKIFDMDI